ncbi:hypothetical protein BDW42DRAFT_184266 [Aspergillus taichungensis]|uniref:S-adenosylmethionine-dependent methyltransferase-like protein n=1 Tax=Aspergillus taichungensis TaxID=482145 RepID=A0A2J5I0E2_9EURO|nr:hypothetical protein BDW42DRAFT_184266 [Aspergillus taichungensis]
MPLFRRSKHKSPPTTSPAFRSVENLLSNPPGVVDLDRRFSVSTTQDASSKPLPQPHSSATQPSFPRRAQSQRRSQNFDSLPTVNPPVPTTTLNTIASTTPTTTTTSTTTATTTTTTTTTIPPSWPSSSEEQLEEKELPTKSRRSLFSRHPANPPRDPPGFLGRNLSVRKPSPSDPRHRRPLSLDTTTKTHHHHHHHHRPALSAPDDAVEPHQNIPESSMPQNAVRPPHSPLPPPPAFQRSTTDSSRLESLYRPSPVEPSRLPSEGNASNPHLDRLLHTRPPSRQSLGPPSPLPPHPPHSELSSATSLSGMSDRPSGGSPAGPSANTAAAASSGGHSPYPQGSAPETGLRGNAATPPHSQQQSQSQPPPPPSESARSPPSAPSNRAREESADVDVRTLVQKHDELQAKYSKVKRYYFEKEAQVQHLQNTVAHQRMAVSRTVLDDNEYANRFGRLEGAIKDLAFAVRKDWKSLPSWLVGFVNDDAHQTGTKEMTAIGRAVISRWLVDELFECHFHPALESNLSRQLKSIEMNLRRQQGQTTTEEDKENAIARISNWRRTTLDGLTDALHGPAADTYRADLIERLVSNLVATLVMHLGDPPPPGIDNGVRMIVENAVGIADKIPLESRDVCVEYVLPGTPLREMTMKVETGIPPLTSVSSEAISGAALRGSVDQDRSPEGPGPEDADADREDPSGPAPADGKQRRSMFTSLMMGRRPVPNAGGPSPSGPAGSAAGSSGEASRPVAEERGGTASHGRVRLACFVTAEVRGRGPMNVLVKSPVYTMD